ncbi:spore coat protein YsxE [Bacillus sp. 2205SS5-2]|uniref:spore coat protein YsxE n=1 Tax=Bacillus sp. 2205SS5-2 TaxID=3109031 RepID=UPI0030056F0A
METNRLNRLSPILQNYGIEPHFIEELGKVSKVYSSKGTFALKKIQPEKGIDFVSSVQYLYQQGYNRIVPIYPTMDGRYAVWQEEGLYYLMPWLINVEKEDRHEKHQKLFRELARLHHLSTSERPIKVEERQEHYEMTTEKWDKQTEFIDEFLDRCEKKIYMSPFELLFCTYYYEISQSIRFSRKKLDSWYEETKEKDKVRTVMIHGKLSSEHFLFDERGLGFFSNFEDTKTASPIHDLIPFISRTLQTYPKPNDECFEWLSTYFQHFPFREEENLLFLSYLAYPSLVIKVVEEYHHREKKNEAKLIKKLQRQYWGLKNIEYIVMKMEELEQKKKAEAAEANQEGASS